MSHLRPLVLAPRLNVMALVTLINRLINGATNCVGTATLTNGSTTTTLNDQNIKAGSKLRFEAITADAAAVKASLWYDPTSIPVKGGQVTLHHSLIAAADCKFDYTVNI